MSSTASSPAPLRWGILGLGWISTKFSLDLLIDPSTRGTTDVAHKIVAVGSRSKEKAQTFVDQVWKEAGVSEGKDDVKLYGSYEELVADPDIDVIYVGTPHSHHYQHVHLALTANKHVLCEKSMTVNAPQTERLIALAKEKNLFLMEAHWTHFQPFAHKLQEIVDTGVIGEVKSVAAELCIDFTKTVKEDPGHRIYNPDLAGGALLDLGPYMWVHAALLLVPRGPGPALPVPKVVSSLTKTPSGVDNSVTAIISFPSPFSSNPDSIIPATLTCAQDHQTPRNRVAIVKGTKGNVEVSWASYRPEGLTVTVYDSEEDYGDAEKEPSRKETVSFVPRPGGIWGFAWEADEVARCIKAGKIESDRLPLRQTVLMMQVFDEIRRQGDFRYPEALETLDISK